MCKLDAAALAATGKSNNHQVPGPTTNCSAANSTFAVAGCPISKAPVDIYPWPVTEQQRVCANCGTHHGPAHTWRTGPAGRKTLCNACGLGYSRLGANGLHKRSRAASAAPPELAAVPASKLATTQPPLERLSSACSNFSAKPKTSTSSTAAAAARPNNPINTTETFSTLGAAAPAVQLRPSQRPNTNAAVKIIEPCNIRRSQRTKRPRVMYDEVDSLQPARTKAMKLSSASNQPAVSAATGASRTCKPQRQKRPRDATGEAQLRPPGNKTKARKVTFSSAASAASGRSGQAYAAEAVEPIELEESAAGTNIRAQAKQVLSLVAPRASGLQANKHCDVAQQKARHCVGVMANAAAATAEAEEAAEILLGMAGRCGLDRLVAVCDQELDGF